PSLARTPTSPLFPYTTLFRSGKGEWRDIHNDPLIGIARADQLVPEFLADDFPTPGVFRSLKFEEAIDVRDRARRMIELARRKTGDRKSTRLNSSHLGISYAVF